jgi:hypothetical protein
LQLLLHLLFLLLQQQRERVVSLWQWAEIGCNAWCG